MKTGRQKGCITWNKGLKCPQISKAMKGRPKSLEHKKNLSIATKKRLSNPKNHPMWKDDHHYTKICFNCGIKFKVRLSKNDIENKLNRGKFCSRRCLNIDRSRRNSEISPTSIEKKVYQELKNRGFLFEKQKLINGKFLVDAYIPVLNLVIECDGDYWHSLDRIIKRDKTKNAYLTKCGFNLLHLTETEINKDVKIAIERIYS